MSSEAEGFAMWLLKHEMQFAEFEEKVPSNSSTGASEIQPQPQFSDINLEERNVRTVTTSARYLPINRAIKSFHSEKQLEHLKRKIKLQDVKSQKSLYFYFLMLTYTFGRTGMTLENYNKLFKKVNEELEKYQFENHHDEVFKRTLFSEVQRIIEGTEEFFKGNWEESIRLCYNEKKRFKKNNRGNAGNMMKDCISKVKAAFKNLKK